MYKSLFETLYNESFVSPFKTVYVVSDNQLEEIRRKQNNAELNNLEESRKRLEEIYESRIKTIDKRKIELKEELKTLNSKKKESIKV